MWPSTRSTYWPWYRLKLLKYHYYLHYDFCPIARQGSIYPLIHNERLRQTVCLKSFFVDHTGFQLNYPYRSVVIFRNGSLCLTRPRWPLYPSHKPSVTFSIVTHKPCSRRFTHVWNHTTNCCGQFFKKQPFSVLGTAKAVARQFDRKPFLADVSSLNLIKSLIFV